MYPSAGLQTALNKMREMSVQNNSIYHQYVPVVTDSTTIGEFGQPILDSQNVNVLNDFVGLLKKVVMTAVYNKTFNNPLASLEGDRMPMGQWIENTYVNPAKARGFNVNDFAGLLQKYEAQVAVEYLGVNSDLQYCVTITREKIRNAFTSWDNLEGFVSGMINSLYNGAYITRYNQTKGLVLSAYTAGAVQTEQVTAVTDETTGKALLKKMRADYNKMQIPSTAFNAWNKVKEDGFALKTWTDPQDIIVMISADVEANVSVDVLAAAFNMDKADFLGRVIVVDDFSQYNEDGTVAIDGSAIQAMICDRAFFKIKTQDFAADEFYNANNRTWQYYLNDVRMVNYSLFANAKVYSTEEAPVPGTPLVGIRFSDSTYIDNPGQTVNLQLVTDPVDATLNRNEMQLSSVNPDIVLTIDSENPRIIHAEIGNNVTAGTYGVSVQIGDLTAEAYIRVIVIPQIESMWFETPTSVSAGRGDTVTFNVVTEPEDIPIYSDNYSFESDNQDITFEVSNEDTRIIYVHIGNNVPDGTYNISASIGQATATGSITVITPAQSVSFENSTLTVEQGSSATNNFVITPSGTTIVDVSEIRTTPAATGLSIESVLDNDGYVTGISIAPSSNTSSGTYEIGVITINELDTQLEEATMELTVTAPIPPISDLTD